MSNIVIPSTLRKENGVFVKTCVHCKATLPLHHFKKHLASLDGYKHVCKLCTTMLTNQRRMDRLKVQESVDKLITQEYQAAVAEAERQRQERLQQQRPTLQMGQPAQTDQAIQVSSNGLPDLSVLQTLAKSGFSVTITISKEGAKA